MSAQPEAANRSDTAGIPLPPPVIYVAGFAVGVVLELIVPIERAPVVVDVVGAVVCFGLWLVLDGAAMVRFFRAGTSIIPFKPTTALVTEGPYRFTRNPMYLGMAFLYASLAFAFGVVWAFISLPLVILAVDRIVIAREEPYLERRFGDDYLAYKRRVRRWI